jgi:hypothetical protein
MQGAATQAMRCHRRGAATPQMPARRRAPSGCGPQARWLRCSLLACDSFYIMAANCATTGVRRNLGLGLWFLLSWWNLPSHKLFNPARPEAMLTYNPACSSLTPCQRAWGPAAKCVTYFVTGSYALGCAESRLRRSR